MDEIQFRPRKRIKFLTGAPSKLQIKSGSDSATSLLPAFQRFLGESEPCIHNSFSDTESCPIPKWRLVPLDKNADTTAFSFLSVSHSFGDDGNNFVRHSFRLHIQNEEQTNDGDLNLIEDIHEISDGDTSFITTTDGDISFHIDSFRLTNLPSEITDIRNLPNAQELDTLLLRRRNVNLMVGVISKTLAREVVIRKTKVRMKILELLVGDETRAGFSITFWLPSTELTDQENSLAFVLSHVRSRDLLLITNVGLNQFQGTVHGQSLSKNAWRSETIVQILGRNGGIQADLSGSSLVKEKAIRVQSWITTFLGVEKVAKTELDDSLPPDTTQSNSF